ncbi:MAG: HEAT repeat domain-containing protein [Acidobacteria bacterium]|nr:HEAT repeat domain-containing protein [Acidobacteriota bacterium]MBV9067559.1 HEAT repeat domain-containing protein [Acidobacteriota bacterium]MBV9184441.1 HEAT repeat domain-containing protein [Acidobacteriota bacterium]
MIRESSVGSGESERTPSDITGEAPTPDTRQPTPASSDVPKESSRTILFQFVVFPLGIVAIAVLIFFLFGKLATDEQGIPDYLNAIRSGSSHERWQAAYQLSKSLKRGEAKRYPNLEHDVATLYANSKSDDPRIRRYLGMVLGQLGDRRATPVLLDGLNDHDIDNRIYALTALGELRDPAAIPRISKAVTDDDKDVRATAYYTLGAIGDPSAVPVLAAGLEEQTPDVRWNAAIALARLGDPRALGTLREVLDRSRLNSVTGMREDQKEDAMIVAMSAYAKLAGKGAASDLQRIASSDPSLRVRAAAKQALAQIGA